VTRLARIRSAFTRSVRKPSIIILRRSQRQFVWRSAEARAQAAASDVSRRTIGHSLPLPRFSPWWAGSAFIAVILLVLATHEIRTSALQAWVLSRSATRLSYEVGSGPSPRIAFPETGPFDERLGYTRIAEFQRRLENQGFTVTAQSRLSPTAARLAAWGVFPPYREPTEAGLIIRDKDGVPLHHGAPRHGAFRDLADIPPVMVATLLFIEDRGLQEPADPRRNPVVDWPRLVKATTLYAGRKVGLPLPAEGGSTLATQLEKFQHSHGGTTTSPWEKLRQLVSASLRVYRQGADTRTERDEILLQYINKLPLAAAPGWGEVNGLAAALVAWFGMHPTDTFQALADPSTPEAARAYKHVLALLCAARAPTFYLLRDRTALEVRMDRYLPLLTRAGIVDAAFADRVRATPLGFLGAASSPAPHLPARKAVDRARIHLGQMLGEPSLYDLDRFHIEADSTIDGNLQGNVEALLARLRDRQFLAREGLVGDSLLGGGDPRDVLYSVLLLERTPLGQVVRVRADGLPGPFDLNRGLKMELGSTAKLRTLAHYLEVMAGLHDALARPQEHRVVQSVRAAGDPLTQWAAETLRRQPELGLEAFLRRALERSYSASPAEVFFTGGGVHTFANYTLDANGTTYSVRKALSQSVNLVYIRLMRDLVRFHAARLPYDARGVLAEIDHPERRRLLEEIAKAESRMVLALSYKTYKGLPRHETERRLLGRHANDPRRLALLFYAWNPGGDDEALAEWLRARVGPLPKAHVRRLVQAYGNPRLTLADFGYLLRRPPLEIWSAGELARAPETSWESLLAQSEDATRVASHWLFRTRNRRAQEVRLRTRIEQDAFARMTPAWKRLGFPFDRLVPSLATAIGSSSDRPDALADLMGIIQNDGARAPIVTLRTIRFGAGTPFETVLQRSPAPENRVMHPVVAGLLRDALESVVRGGTARRLTGAFTDEAGTPFPVGGKTGSGDNRLKTFARGGGLIASRPLSRTATFVFFAGDRHVGVITAIVTGTKAGRYHFTSALPVAILKLMAPSLERNLRAAPPVCGTTAEADCAPRRDVVASRCSPDRTGGHPDPIG
jgi:membrane peptidoglycan carboxypeptidase